MSRSRRLAEFVVEARLADIPPDVVDYAKLVLLDCLLCGVAAARLERSRIAQRLAIRFGGPQESTVFGTSTQVAAVNAAYANAEMMNALDSDETFAHSHFAIVGAAAGLAEAERRHSSGSDLLLSTLMAFEVNARLHLSASLVETDESGRFRWSALASHGYAGFGGAAACAVLGGGGTDMLTHAFGLVGWTAPTAKNLNLTTRSRFNSFKYAPYGAITQAGVIAAALAEEGYVGDDDILDIDPGFLRGQGYIAGDPSVMLAGLGDSWHILDTRLKGYPANAYVNVILAAVVDFVGQHRLRGSDIGAIRVYLTPGTTGTRFFNDPLRKLDNDHLAPLHGAFNVPHLVSLAVLGYAPGPDWFAPEALQNPDVAALSARVRTVVPGPDQPDAEALAGSVAFELGNGRYLLNTQIDEGGAATADWQFVAQKLSTYCAGILDSGRQSDLLRLLQELESVDDVARRLSPLLAVR